MNHGFLRLQRSLYDCPLWRSVSPEYRSIFMSIYVSCVWEEQDFNDHGMKTHLNPGQCILTERQLIDLAFPPTNDTKKLAKYKSCVHRALEKFEKLGFSNHKTNQRKTLHTMVRIDILSSFEPNFEPRANQERTKSEPQKKKEKKEKKEEEAAWAGSSIFFDRGSGNFVGLTDVFIASLQNLYPLIDVWQEIANMKHWLLTHPKGLKCRGDQSFIENWLKRDYSNHKPVSPIPSSDPIEDVLEQEDIKTQKTYKWKKS